MLRSMALVVPLALLGYALWASASIKTIAAGVAIFLFGMLAMEEGFKALTGGLLEGVLRRVTDRLWKSLAFGIVSTTIMQSSSLVSVVAISFLGAGLIDLVAGIGIIFGANLGTTTGAWLVAGLGLKVDIAAVAMPMLVFGVVLVMQSGRSLRGLGYVLAGLGFIFLGIHYMKDGFEAFKEHVDLAAYAMPGLTGLLVYVLIGLVATVVMQSSHAALVLTITALAAGQIQFDNALALAIGSNIGTTVTAIIGALGSNLEGKRLAAAHLLFNVGTALVAIVLIDPLVQGVHWLSAWLGIAADDHALRLAVFHTLFNVLGLFIMLPLTGRLVALLQRLMPETPTITLQPRYLNEASLALPEASVEAVRRETRHLLAVAFEIIAHGLGLHRRELLSEAPLAEVVERRDRPVLLDIDERYERAVKPLFGAIVEFISRAQAADSSAAAEDLFALRTACRHIAEAVKGMKHLNKNLSRQMHSGNPDIRAQYNRIRIQLGEVLRSIGAVASTEILDLDAEDDVTALSYDDAKLELQALDAALMAELTRLMRSRRLPPTVTTSIMNDTHYAHEIGLDLIEVAQVLGPVGSAADRAALRELTLDTTEIRAMRAAASEETPP